MKQMKTVEFDGFERYEIVDAAARESITQVSENVGNTLESFRSEFEDFKKTTRENLITHNRNLLDNAWFTIMQDLGELPDTLGIWADEIKDNKLFADRWRTVGMGGAVKNGAVSIGSGVGVDIENASISQRIENRVWDIIAGNLVTASVKLGDGRVLYGTFRCQQRDEFGGMPDSVSSSMVSENIMCFLRVENDSLYFELDETWGVRTDIIAVKLELGSISTLAYDVCPDYTEELLKCQRHRVVLKARDSSSYSSALSGGTSSTNVAYFVLHLPVKMCRDTQIYTTFSGLTIYPYIGGVHPNVTSVTGTIGQDSRTFSLTVAMESNSSVAANRPAILEFKDRNSYIVIGSGY